MEQDLLRQMQSILMHPERHYTNVKCPHCKSTQIEYHGNGENYTNEADDFFADQGIVRDARHPDSSLPTLNTKFSCFSRSRARSSLG